MTTYMDPEVDVKIVTAFVARHIRGDVTDIISALLEHCDSDVLPFDIAPLDIAELIKCPFCESVIARGPEEIDSVLTDFEMAEEYYDSAWPHFHRCEDCGVMLSYDELGVEVDFPKRWLLVTESLAKALFHQGEIVLDGRYWGRYVDDDDYVHDKTIMALCDELGILTGQKNCPV